jgi:hypothetical protein
MKTSIRHLAISLILFVGTITGTSVAWADSWQKCAANPSNCPAFFDLYPKDKAFRNAFNDTIQRAGIRKPGWLSRSTAAAAERLPGAGGNRFLLFACEPHNCGGHAFFTIYDPLSGLVRGLYVVDGNRTFFGDLSTEEKNLLLAKLN